MNPIHIVNAADAAYVPHTAAMLHSVFASNPGEAFQVHFLHRPGIEKELLDRLAALCEQHNAIFIASAVNRELLDGFPMGGWFPEEAWYRVILPRLLPGLDRVLWLDSDVIVFGAIKELWDTDLEDKPLAACPNALLYDYAQGVANMGIMDRKLYFNTGVLLLNLEQMRLENSEQTLRKVAQENSQWIKFADQDVLNCAYHKRYKRLPLAWNLLTHSYINVPETVRVHGKSEYKDALKSPKILHFTGHAGIKPWSFKCGHPHRDAYLHHRVAAGWPLPQYPDKNMKNSIIRNMPMRLYALLNALKKGNYREMFSYLRQW